MALSTILYITLALLVALGFAFFQYLFRKKNLSGKDYIFFGMRTLAVFLVLLLLINPKIISTTYELEKPELVILSDNSQSVSYLDEQENLLSISNRLAENDKLKENFQVSRLNFGEKLNISDSLDFSATQTDIFSALSETENIYSGRQSAIVLITDGNQSLGRDYRYFKNKQNISIFPVIIGDTATYKDLSIERINANRYAFLNNRFPVEAFLNYSGDENIQATVKIKSGDAILYTQNIEFSKEVKSQIVRTDLPANSLGVKTYTFEIEALENEKNKLNNKQNFAVEVIDERTSVLVLSDISHPDLGALQKSIESNQQRTVDIKYVNDKNLQISEYQLIIIYQINRSFNKYISEILENDHNYLLITGSKTDWNYLNDLGLGYTRSSVNQPQEFFPVYNNTFSAFQFEDIGFDDFPPLQDKFGTLDYDENKFNIMLYQEIEGVETTDPLMAVSQNSPKSGFLFGENIWRWRAKSYLDNNSFQEFDDFFGKLIQNLAKNSLKQRLTVEVENFYYANQNVLISAQYFDENYQFDSGVNLKIKVENKENEDSFTSDLILKNNFYELDAGDLPPGEYFFNVYVADKNLSESGSFEVIDYNSEQQFVSANLSAMKSFAANNQTAVSYPDQLEEVINALLSKDKFKPVQKSRQKSLPLIDWYYLLFILVIVLAAEWFYRKYLGLI
ncbi:vWA domain-containing protein [Christiangramia sediminis]|uniref:VWA domain-containing protein n=1 Tax=Christiangramia sediminis TaxID=2881336 RepID=A0A9X1LHF0_9FLAO|nr:vWA domain-containing protein [Christiangramia sediminis]MCB7480372.1 VWA domain-containing protein [Christiangramia sediminis]